MIQDIDYAGPGYDWFIGGLWIVYIVAMLWLAKQIWQAIQEKAKEVK